MVGASFDLHVLSTPPAFILSQDQTLILKSLILFMITFLANQSLLLLGRFAEKLDEPACWRVLVSRMQQVLNETNLLVEF